MRLDASDGKEGKMQGMHQPVYAGCSSSMIKPKKQYLPMQPGMYGLDSKACVLAGGLVAA